MTTLKLPPPCYALLQTELVEMDSGRAVCLFRPTPEMENPMGTIQGGILAAFLDNVIGPAIFSAVPDKVTSTLQLSINYLRPVKAGEVIRGIAQVLKQGRSQIVLEAWLERESDGELLVKASTVNLLLG
jgi:uncharacterized protein (TIGR00369 family)